MLFFFAHDSFLCSVAIFVNRYLKLSNCLRKSKMNGMAWNNRQVESVRLSGVYMICVSVFDDLVTA